MTTTSEGPFLTIEDVARLLHKTVNGVRKMRALGHLPRASRRGNRLYWRTQTFMQWMDDGLEPDDFDPGPPPRRV